MSDSARGQLVSSAAEVYEEFFLPAIFQEWTTRLADAAQIAKGHRVLDVACGTGALARTAREQIGPEGAVVGVDINEGMLTVANKKAPEIEWRRAPAEKLPFDDNVFDAVVSQFGLMFFDNQRAALMEMARVLRSGRYLAVAVWDSLANTPGYAAMTALLTRLFGAKIAAALEAPFALGDKKTLHSLFTDAGMPGAVITTQEGTARFPSIQAWVHTDIKGWTLADMIDDAQHQLLLSEAEQTLKPFVTAGGTVSFKSPAHIVTWRKPK
ncbi:MAG: class I SAM-dependent methyltransferase [Candidatus Binatia bacterium]